MHTTTETYFGLNGVGRRVWDLLEGGATELPMLIGRLQEQFPDVPEEMLASDTEELLAELVGHGLLAPPPAASST